DRPRHERHRFRVHATPRARPQDRHPQAARGDGSRHHELRRLERRQAPGLRGERRRRGSAPLPRPRLRPRTRARAARVAPGGPESQYQPGFLGRLNFLLNELGVALIMPNVRGSKGFGKTFLTLDNAEKREDSVKDVGALLDWIANQPALDSKHVMVRGGSYGG